MTVTNRAARAETASSIAACSRRTSSPRPTKGAASAASDWRPSHWYTATGAVRPFTCTWPSDS